MMGEEMKIEEGILKEGNAESWNRDGLQTKLAEIAERQARERAEETATRQFYRWLFYTLLLTGIAWGGLTL